MNKTRITVAFCILLFQMAAGLAQNNVFQGAQWIAMEQDRADLHIVPGLHLRQGVKAVYGDKQLPTYQLPLLRKDFSANKGIKQAVAYICGLGHFDFFLNGQKVGNHYLDCGWTLYSKEALYETFDVTKLLKQGDNTVGVMLAKVILPAASTSNVNTIKGKHGILSMNSGNQCVEVSVKSGNYKFDVDK